MSSDDPAVRAGIEATRGHYSPGPDPDPVDLGCCCGWRYGTGTANYFREHITEVGVEAARPIIEAEYQNRMVELTKAPITAADLNALAINDLTDAERDAFVAALTEGRAAEEMR